MVPKRCTRKYLLNEVNLFAFNFAPFARHRVARYFNATLTFRPDPLTIQIFKCWRQTISNWQNPIRLLITDKYYAISCTKGIGSIKHWLGSYLTLRYDTTDFTSTWYYSTYFIKKKMLYATVDHLIQYFWLVLTLDWLKKSKHRWTPTLGT